jgi:glucuronoarabinoxylan endo-1,4-beta-xylanase
MRRNRMLQGLLAMGAATWLLLGGARQGWAAQISVDRATKYQTIEGFGFYGAMDNWWGEPADLENDAWATQVLGDLGITIWRNEYLPPSDALAEQDADWAKQRPVVQTLKRVADANHVPFRVLLSIWSPPSAMKCLSTDASGDLPIEGTAPQSTKGGNTLCRGSRDAFAAWLIAGLQMYRDVGVEVYGLSLQNEPYFWEFYNSCFYLQEYYAETLAYVGPKLKAAFPGVKLFGPENMLEMEAGPSKDYFYTGIARQTGAASYLDALAVHGYTDGVVPSPGSTMAALWSTMDSYFAQPMGKPLWMTETSGYVDTWTTSVGSDGVTYPGASDLGYAIYAALAYGHASAWVWWQGSNLAGVDTESLMAGTATLSKRYYVAKQFFRFIRPGATMVKVSSSDPAVFVATFEHTGMGSFTTILINSSAEAKTVQISGAGVPSQLSLFRTSPNENCVAAGVVNSSGFTLAGNSINTLVYGNVYEGSSGGGGGIVAVPALSWPSRVIALLLVVAAAAGSARRRRRGRLAYEPPRGRASVNYLTGK